MTLVTGEGFSKLEGYGRRRTAPKVTTKTVHSKDEFQREINRLIDEVERRPKKKPTKKKATKKKKTKRS